MVEERHTGFDVRFAAALEIDRNYNFGFLGLTFNRAGASHCSPLLHESRLHSAGMIIELFKSRQLNNFGSQSLQGTFVGLNNSSPFEKIVGAQWREKARTAARRKHVIWPGKIVSQWRRRIRADENSAR